MTVHEMQTGVIMFTPFIEETHFTNYTTMPLSEVTKVYLQRQGASKTLNTNNNMSLPFHLEFKNWAWRIVGGKPVSQDTEDYSVDISYSCDDEMWGKKNGQFAYHGEAGQRLTLPDAFVLAQKKVKELFDLDIEIQSEIEAHCYRFGIHYPFMDNDVFLTCCQYDEDTDSVIAAGDKSNWYIRWIDGDINKPEFNSWPQIQEMCKEAHEEFIKPHNQQDTEFENKCWLAWLAGEYLKDRLQLPFIICKEIGIHKNQPKPTSESVIAPKVILPPPGTQLSLI